MGDGVRELDEASEGEGVMESSDASSEGDGGSDSTLLAFC
jgi:hypothetical protein